MWDSGGLSAGDMSLRRKGVLFEGRSFFISF